MLDVGPLPVAWSERCPNCLGAGTVPGQLGDPAIADRAHVREDARGRLMIRAGDVACSVCAGQGLVAVRRA